MAIFFGSLPISLIADKVIFFLGFDALYLYLKFKSLEQGTFFARDLVSEPGNILHPDEDAKRINLTMDESEQLHPEQSTTAIISLHSKAKYFSA